VFSVRYMLKLCMYFRLMSVFEMLKLVLLLTYEFDINIIEKKIIYESISAIYDSRRLWNEACHCAGCSVFSYSSSGKPVKWRKFEGDISGKILPNKPATIAMSN
jgi:hypothetical protein